MTVKIRRAINQIILLLVAAGMISGLIYSAVFDESYDIVQGLSEYQNEMNSPSLPALSDIIADSSANADNSLLLTEGGRSGRPLIAGIDNTGRTDFTNFYILSFCIFISLSCVIFCTSFKHIFYIHLKDGNK